MIDWLTQLLRCNRGINLRTTTQWRHSLQRHIHDNASHGTLRADMTSSIKLEVHHVSQRRRNRNEPRLWVTMLNNLVKIGRVVLCYLFCRVLVFFQYRAKRLAGKNISEWPILCRVGHKTLQFRRYDRGQTHRYKQNTDRQTRSSNTPLP